MSTVYYVADPAQKKAGQELQDILKGICSRAVEKLESAPNDAQYPALNAYVGAGLMVENAAESVKRVFQEVLLDAGSGDDVRIGSLSGYRFSWDTYEGFHGPGDLRAYLEGHPGFQIYDEYGEEFTLDAFLKEIGEG